ncbi:MAG: hypothetical protein QOF78_3018, partial [Phycisphaerales bacterium]|nr:hypothetical protein [Phycisphaerales bacterium]
HLLRGNGDGTFQPAVTRAQWAFVNSVAAGHFNNDGNVDLLVTLYDDFSNLPYFQVQLGNGQGGFADSDQDPWQWGKVSSWGGLPADLNHDGKLDVVTPEVQVLLGNGNGSLQSESYAAEHPLVRGRAVATGDFTGDGITDLVVAGYNDVLAVLPGKGDGDFDAPIPGSANGTIHTGVATADFNADGCLDAVVSNEDAGTASLMLGNGDGTLRYAGAFATGTSPSGVVVGDFNRDGRPDVAVSNGVSATRNLSVLLNDGVWGALPPSLRITDATVVEGHSGTANAVFTVTLEGAATSNVSVNYSTANGTATVAGGDYLATSGTLTFSPGQTSKTITVQVKGDRIGEADEQFYVNLNAATNATIIDSRGIGTIQDDEPYISVNNASATEGNSGTTPMTFTVTLSAASDLASSVDFSTASASAVSGEDFNAATGRVTFLPGQTSKSITVAVRGDVIDEFGETFWLNLFGATNGRAGSPGVGTIADDDPPPAIVISDVSRAEGNSGTTPFTFTVSLALPSEKVVSVNYATAAGTASNSGGNIDYQSKSGTLSFALGEVSQTVTVSVIGDTRNESDETFFVNLSSPSNATIADLQGVGTILNDESRGKQWVGPASGGSWSTASNWSPSGVPSSTSLVTISGALVTLAASATVSELSLRDGARLTLSTAGSRVLRTSGFFLDTSASLDLNDNDMILDYVAGSSPLGAWNGWYYDGVLGMITTGRNGGAWDGVALVTSRPDALSGLTTLAAADASSILGISGFQTALWNGQTVDATTVLVKYTYDGDANLDGIISGDDYSTIDFNVGTSAFGYSNGDFNYDGIISGDDYSTIDFNYAAQGLPL